MASRDEVVEAVEVEAHEEIDDPVRPGMRWCRDWWPDADGSIHHDQAWGEIGVRCMAGHRPFGWSVWDEFTNATEEARARAELEALADAHLLEAHAQLSFFEPGCGCR